LLAKQNKTKSLATRVTSPEILNEVNMIHL